MKNYQISIFLLLVFSLLNAQTYNDGPIELKVRVRKILVTSDPQDWAFLGAGFQPDEYTFKIQARDNADLDGLNWVPSTCLQHDGDPPFVTPDYNTIIFSYIYPTTTVPMYFDIKLDAWQDNCGSDAACAGTRCDFDTYCCCGVVWLGMCVGVETNDKIRCLADPYKTNLSYRLGPPCNWYNHGFIQGGSCSNDYYFPEIESYWRYTRGENCSSPIILGSLAPGSGNSLYHFNSNECYANDFGMPGNDVFYEVYFPQPIGIIISLCGNTTFNSYLYLLDSNCNIVESNDDFCANKSQIRRSICYPGKYYIVVDGLTSSDAGTFELTVEEDTTLTFTLNIDSTGVSCAGGNDGQLVAIVNGGFPPYSFLWSNGQTDSIITGLTAGTYWVAVSDNTGCTLKDTITINQPPPLNVTINTTPSTCGGANNGVASAVVSGGVPPYSYLWQVNPPQITQTAINLAPGTYNVIITDKNGCVIQSTFSIGATLSIQPQIDSIKNASCAGYSDGNVYVSLIGGNPPYQYLWSNGSTTNFATGLSAGVYTLSAVDAQNCTISMSVTVTEPPPLTTTLIQIISPKCAGGSDGAIDIYTSGGTPPYYFLWSNGSTSEDLINISAGLYSLTIKDFNNCQITSAFTVSEPPQISLQTTVNDVTCKNANNGTIIVIPIGGSPPYQLIWNTGQTQNTLTGLSGGIYLLTITDAVGCSKNFFFVIEEPDSLKVSLLSVVSPTCAGDSNAIIDIQTWGGTPPYSFTWNNNSTLEDLFLIPAGNYSLTVQDANGCYSTISVNVQDPTPISITSAIKDVSCYGFNDGNINVFINGGVPPYSILWSNGATSPSLQNIPGGVYLLTIKDKNNCYKYWVGYVREPPPLQLTVFTYDIRCPGYSDGSAVASAYGGTPPYTYYWNTTPPQYSQQALNLEPGSYSVTVYDFNQCSISSPFTIYEPLEPPDNCSITPPYFVLTPNAFSPNNDGINDKFVIYTKGTKYIKLFIFNRWGNLIYYAETSDNFITWDGTFKNNPAPEDTYIYKIITEYSDGRIINNIGRFHLLR